MHLGFLLLAVTLACTCGWAPSARPPAGRASVARVGRTLRSRCCHGCCCYAVGAGGYGDAEGEAAAAAAAEAAEAAAAPEPAAPRSWLDLLLHGSRGKQCAADADADADAEPTPKSHYVPPEEWEEHATEEEIRRERRVVWDAQREGNRLRQNGILRDEMGKG